MAHRALLVWVFDRTGSLPVVMLMATSLIASWTSLKPLALSRTTRPACYLALTAAWCTVVAVLGLTNRGSPVRATAPHGGGPRGGSA